MACVGEGLKQARSLGAVGFYPVVFVGLLHLAFRLTGKVSGNYFVALVVMPAVLLKMKKFLQDRIDCGFFFFRPSPDDTFYFGDVGV